MLREYIVLKWLTYNIGVYKYIGMIIERYGVKLERLTENKIEMVRHWRNDQKISQYMEYRELITSEMQKKWFQRINNVWNYYFIINFDGNEIGMINIRDIDSERKCGEGGIFIYEDKYLNSDVSFRAALCLNDFCYEKLNLEYIVSHILCSNKRAIQFNKLLGYTLCKGQELIENQEYVQNRETYYKSTDKIKHLFC